MAATVYISESNGAVETVTDNVANLNFGSFDGPNIVTASYPIVPNSYSVLKWWRVKLAVLGGSSQIGNIKLWKSSGAYVTGETIGGNLCNPVNNYYCPSYAHRTQIEGGAAVTTPYSGDGNGIFQPGTFATFPVPTASPASNVYVGGTGGGAIVGVGYSNYFVTALGTTASTPIGPVNQKVFTLQYDEA